MTTCAQWQARLDEADLALHTLRTGGQTVVVRYGEKQVNYSPASIRDLQAYVTYLQGKVDACNGVRGTARRIVQVIPSDGC